jgi:DNA-binding IclR family transcriptional regulator
MWIVPLAVAVCGLALLAWCAARVTVEMHPTRRAAERFGRDVRVALVRVRDETARARRRLDD